MPTPKYTFNSYNNPDAPVYGQGEFLFQRNPVYGSTRVVTRRALFNALQAVNPRVGRSVWLRSSFSSLAEPKDATKDMPIQVVDRGNGGGAYLMVGCVGFRGDDRKNLLNWIRGYRSMNTGKKTLAMAAARKRERKARKAKR